MLSELWSKLNRKSGVLNLSLRGGDHAGRPTSAEESGAPNRGFSFAVDAVKPATKPMWEETLGESLARRFQRRIVALSEEGRAVVNSTWDAVPKNLRGKLDVGRVGSRLHPLMDAVHVAF